MVYSVESQFSKPDKNKFKIIVLVLKSNKRKRRGGIAWVGYLMVEIVYKMINNCIFRWKPIHGVHNNSESQFVTPILQHHFITAVYECHFQNDVVDIRLYLRKVGAF